MDRQAWDLVVIGARPPVTEVLGLLRQIKDRHPFVPVVMAVEGAEPETAVTAMKAGAADFFCQAGPGRHGEAHCLAGDRPKNQAG